jgi:hypothetical protein
VKIAVDNFQNTPNNFAKYGDNLVEKVGADGLLVSIGGAVGLLARKLTEP